MPEDGNPLKILEKLSIKGDNLYVNGKRVSTQLKLQGATLAAAWIAAISTSIAAAATSLAYLDSILENLHILEKSDSTLEVIDRVCIIERVIIISEGQKQENTTVNSCENVSS